jgi:hypothetical protein
MIIKTEIDIDRAINQLKNINLDKPWRLDLKLYKKNRTAAQNRILWLWMGYLAKELGHNRQEDVYSDMCEMFLPTISYESMEGKQKERQQGSSGLNTKEFTEFLERIDRWVVSFFGWTLPSPEDLYYEAMGIRK